MANRNAGDTDSESNAESVGGLTAATGKSRKPENTAPRCCVCGELFYKKDLPSYMSPTVALNEHRILLGH